MMFSFLMVGSRVVKNCHGKCSKNLLNKRLELSVVLLRIEIIDYPGSPNKVF